MSEQWQSIEDVEARRMLLRDEDSILEIHIRNKRICLIKNSGKIWAIDAKCPHQGGPFSKGFVNDECQIVCPWHRFAFDLENGESDSGGYFIRTYELKIEGKQMWIKLPKRKFWGFLG